MSPASLLCLYRWLKEQPWFGRRGGRDHLWIFPSGRGASIFPEWRQYISSCIFLSPEASNGHFDHQKDIVIPGYRDTDTIFNELKVYQFAPTVVRPNLIFFRGSYTSHRPGEENFSAGVRSKLAEVMTVFKLPPFMMQHRRNAKVSDARYSLERGRSRKSPGFTFSNTTLGKEYYLQGESCSTSQH